MFDARLRPLVDRLTAPVAAAMARAGVSANAVSIAGAALGLAGAGLIVFGMPLAGLLLFLVGRVADGLDGAVARLNPRGATDFGGYLDIVLDFLVYGAVPLAFAILAPEANGLAAAFLLASFLANGVAFLAFAVTAEKRGLTSRAQGSKSFYFLAGLAEGTETILVFALMCLFPAAFAWLAVMFAVVCLVSAGARIAHARRMLV